MSKMEMRAVAFCFAYLCLLAPRSSAAELTFTLDPSASQVSVSGFIVPVLASTMPQAAGSDVTSYSGTVLLDVDDPLSPTSITFLGGGAAAAISGSWLPQVGGGTPGSFLPGDANPGTPQPANYGLEAQALGVGNLWIAFRDLALSPTSSPLSVSDGTFAADQMLTLSAGSADYTVRSLLFGDINEHVDLVGKMAENSAGQSGSYAVENGVATLRLPVELLVEVDDENTGFRLLELTFTGSVTATAMLTPHPTADIDMDGDVDGQDLLEMLLGFGRTGATLADGDANFDGTVDRADVQIWREQVGTGVGGAAAVASVPEPASLTLALAACVLPFVVCRRRSEAKGVPANPTTQDGPRRSSASKPACSK